MVGRTAAEIEEAFSIDRQKIMENADKTRPMKVLIFGVCRAGTTCMILSLRADADELKAANGFVAMHTALGNLGFRPYNDQDRFLEGHIWFMD